MWLGIEMTDRTEGQTEIGRKVRQKNENGEKMENGEKKENGEKMENGEKRQRKMGKENSGKLIWKPCNMRLPKCIIG